MGYGDQMTFETILSSMLGRVPDTVDKREGSIIYDALAPAAAELAKAYIELDVIMDETFVDTASLQYLILRCRERGVAIRGASAAIIEGVFTPPALELAEGLRFNCGDQNYVITEKMENGRYKLECESPGSAGNQYSGFLLPIQYVEGLQTAQIAGVLIPGEDADDTDTLRKRYYDSLDSLAFGGNIADYKEKVNLIDGVGGVKVWPVWAGGGTVKLTLISSDYRVPSPTLLETVQNAIDPETNHGEGIGLAPIGHTVTVVGVSEERIDVRTNITFVSGWSFEDAKSLIEEAVEGYFLDLAEAWADESHLVVRIALIEMRILGLSCVVDVADTTLNGSGRNVELDAEGIPVLGSVEAAS